MVPEAVVEVLNPETVISEPVVIKVKRNNKLLTPNEIIK